MNRLKFTILVIGIICILTSVFLIFSGIGNLLWYNHLRYISLVLGVIILFSGFFLVRFIYLSGRLSITSDIKIKSRGKKLVCIGGGTGLPTVLTGLKNYTSNITAIVTVSDDGGSSGRLIKDFDILPPGDIRNCIIALAKYETLLKKLFAYRFRKGNDLKGHSFGNLFLTALTELTGNFMDAVRESSKVLYIQGRVLPVTMERVKLCATLNNGKVVKGESNVGKVGAQIKRIFLNPPFPEPYDEVLNAINEADLIVLGPGSLFTSIIPNLLVKDICKYLNSSSAPLIYIANIMTQPGETDNFTLSKHVESLFKFTELKKLDYVLIDKKTPSITLLEKYALLGSYQVKLDTEFLLKRYPFITLIEEDLISQGELLRHDPEKLSAVLYKKVG